MTSSPSTQALVRRSTDTELMPPPPTKRIKRPPKVLDEDTYTDAISEIIARDFFPGLLETRTQQEYLDALESADLQWISSAGRRLTEVMTPGPRRGRPGTSMATPGGPMETPRGYGGDTPMSVISDVSTTSTATTATQKPEVDLNMSLDNFQAKYTSEDNESFNNLLDKQNNKRAQRYAWMWAGNKIPAPRQIKQREREQRLLKARAEQEEVDSGRQLQSIEPADERKARPDGWKAKPDNQFMFAPDSVEDTFETVHQKAEKESRAPPRGVAYNNTRLSSLPQQADPTIPPSPSLSAVQDAIAGHPRPSASEPDLTGGETPRVNGYAFVDDEPTPSELGEDTPSPTLLGPGDATPNPFKIKESSKRESLHLRMVDRVAKKHRPVSRTPSGNLSVSSTPVPKFMSSPRVTGSELTPAGQTLWSKIATPRKGSGGMGIFEGRSRRSGESRESGLKFGWTPTPRAQKGEKT
ncbi:MAG: hypothetical protein M1817_006462 [Caeruleum heppii]|nr:MAG: hypothetical protein M1817_006462 [Caeruleum heppii]